MRTYLSLLWRSSATRRDRSPFRAWRESALVWRGRRGLFSRSLTMSAFPSCASKQAILSQFAASEGGTLFPAGDQSKCNIRPQPSEKYVPKICRISNWRRTRQSGFDEPATTWEGALNLKVADECNILIGPQ